MAQQVEHQTCQYLNVYDSCSNPYTSLLNTCQCICKQLHISKLRTLIIMWRNSPVCRAADHKATCHRIKSSPSTTRHQHGHNWRDRGECKEGEQDGGKRERARARGDEEETKGGGRGEGEERGSRQASAKLQYNFYV